MKKLLIGSFEHGLRRFRRLLRWTLIPAVALVALGAINQSSDIVRMGQGLSVYAAFGIGLLLPSGVVGAERRSGAILLWLQQPGSLLSFYAKRVLALQAVSLCLQIPFAAIVLGGALIEGESIGVAGRSATGLVLLGLLFGFITVAFSCWGIVKDAFAALVYVVASVSIGAPLAFEAMQSGEASVVRHLMPPFDAMERFQDGTAIAGSVALILAHVVVWCVIAGVGLLWLEGRPLPSSAFGDEG